VIEELLGKTFLRVLVSNKEEMIQFVTTDGFVYEMYHEQDCCESVSIDDINGDLDDLVGSPILMAEESCSDNVNLDGTTLENSYDESCTWTFYRFATIKGYVNIRWYGTSNGYYSESVNIYKRVDKQLVRDEKLNDILNKKRD
jgi:hypothetical protein